jgi:hypothetical protein
MGTLSLCADSAHPPGTPTHVWMHQAFINGLCITKGNESYDQKQPKSAHMPYTVITTVTSYYYTHLLSITPSLHATSALTHPYNNYSTATRQLNDLYLLFILCQSITTLFASSF